MQLSFFHFLTLVSDSTIEILLPVCDDDLCTKSFIYLYLSNRISPVSTGIYVKMFIKKRISRIGKNICSEYDQILILFYFLNYMEKYELGFEHDSLNTMVIFVDLVLKLIYDIKCLSKQKKLS